MILVLDESGAKGYATNNEKYYGEVGVMAGYLYTEDEINYFELIIRHAISEFDKRGKGKFHIVELGEVEQKLLRDKVFHAIKELKLQWFYKAIYSEGFHQAEFASGRAGQENRKKSLHVELFEKMLIQSLCMASSVGKKNLNLVIKTDNVDLGTLKKFNEVAESLCNTFLQKETKVFKYVRNTNNKFVKVFSYISVKNESMPKFENISINIECDSSPLTLVADVLANSVNYYLRERQKENLGSSLNHKEAIKNHPLVDFVFVARNENHITPLLDIIYRRQ